MVGAGPEGTGPAGGASTVRRAPWPLCWPSRSGTAARPAWSTPSGRTSRAGLAAGAFTVADPDGSLPQEAFVEIPGRPTVQIHTFSEGDANITLDTVEFTGVPREQAPAFLDAVFGGRAWIRTRLFPASQVLIVPLPGDVTYKEPVLGTGNLTPWLNSIIR